MEDGINDLIELLRYPEILLTPEQEERLRTHKSAIVARLAESGEADKYFNLWKVTGSDFTDEERELWEIKRAEGIISDPKQKIRHYLSNLD